MSPSPIFIKRVRSATTANMNFKLNSNTISDLSLPDPHGQARTHARREHPCRSADRASPGCEAFLLGSTVTSGTVSVALKLAQLVPAGATHPTQAHRWRSRVFRFGHS